MRAPIICFGQQPCGFFPKRFFHAKLITARRLQREIGGRIVYFCHDSDHDYRETITPLRDLRTRELRRLNFDHLGKLQKKYAPLYAKKIRPDWQERTARLLPAFLSPALRRQAADVPDYYADLVYARLQPSRRASNG